jgi:hypothetical protein
MGRVHKRQSHLRPLPVRRSFFQSRRWEGMANFIPVLVGYGLYIIGVGPFMAIGAAFLLVVLGVFVLPTMIDRKMKAQIAADKEAALIQEPHRATILQGDRNLKVLERALSKLPKDQSDTLEKLCDQVTAILNCVDADPTQVLGAASFFDVQLPACSELAKQRMKLVTSPNTQQQATLDQALRAYIDIFEDQKNKVQMPEVSAIELDIKLLQDAMNIEVPKT